MNLFKRKESGIKAPETKHETRKIFQDKFGNNWFEYTDKTNIPATRALAAEVATRFADMNITKERMKGLISKMKEFANSGDVVSLFAVLSEIEFRLDFVGEEETLIELISIYYLIDGESEDLVPSFQDKKKAAIKDDTEARAFFLSRVFQLITNYSALSEADFLKYLKANQAAAERLLRFSPVK
jgi:transcription-repair coupling factor (superfamily II helicase)